MDMLLNTPPLTKVMDMLRHTRPLENKAVLDSDIVRFGL